MIPEAIVFESIPHKIKGEKTYKVGDSKLSDKWDDSYYYTTINGIDINGQVRVAYIGQTPNNSTINKLRELELYEFDEKSKKVIINAPLPKHFYSFWEINFPLDPEELHKMYYFNHLFYRAITKYIIDPDIFIQKLDKYISKFNVLKGSVLKDKKTADLKKQFNDFSQLFLNKYKYFEIIDIKYLDTKYVRDRNKIEEIKRRSIRKQFVYEHLLQKTLKKREAQYSNLSIRSSFWLPSYQPDDSELLQDSSPFMDGYIKLKNVNFKLLAETYFA
jgi:hypothetical protein